MAGPYAANCALQGLMQYSFFLEHGEDVGQQTVDERAGLGRAVALGYFDVFVDADRNGNLGEVQDFGQGGGHDHHVHESEAVGLPFVGAQRLLYPGVVFGLTLDGGLE